ncbi:YcxB family protein [Clostridium sp. MSJ-4]|uniref:YcxB family protein n=1 Tax=Clostridium simiarum TaxID=2841506 RepID=A0ABS6F1K9_9CLOT|nr:YcxB family protein [Clostridium simiarum]MBU5592166.1 YcxB family protein [Clostridium simiarum]
MKIDYELTKEDYINFNIYHMDHSETMRRSLFIQRYIISLIFLIVPFVVTGSSDIPLWYWLSIFIIIFVLWVAFYPRYIKWMIKRRLTKMLQEGKNAGLLGKGSISLTEEGIVKTSDSDDAKTSWSTVEKIIETKELVIIYISAVSAYIIPIKAFNNNTHKEEFVNKLNYMWDKTN